jgi:chemotaxis protein CheX
MSFFFIHKELLRFRGSSLFVTREIMRSSFLRITVAPRKVTGVSFEGYLHFLGTLFIYHTKFGGFFVQASYINPFLASSVHVIETFVQTKPTIGSLSLQSLELLDNHIWLKIGIIGHFKSDVVFGFPEQVALKLVSAMMGGYTITELDEMCRSAISELGNMISGNASTILYNDGIHVDITPPSILQAQPGPQYSKALAVPLSIAAVGDFRIHMVVSG